MKEIYKIIVNVKMDFMKLLLIKQEPAINVSLNAEFAMKQMDV